jgi:hypothetical protein
METYVKGHESHSKTGELEEIKGHYMHVNPRIHKRHLRNVEKMEDALESEKRVRV